EVKQPESERKPLPGDVRARKEAEHRAAQVQQLVTTARTAITGKNFDNAAQALADASKLAPQDPAILQAQKDLDLARRKQDEDQRAERVRQLRTSGRASLAAGKLDAAGRDFTEASRLAPQDPAVVKASRDLEQARTAAAAEEDRRKRQADYQQALQSGRAAL